MKMKIVFDAPKVSRIVEEHDFDKIATFLEKKLDEFVAEIVSSGGYVLSDFSWSYGNKEEK